MRNFCKVLPALLACLALASAAEAQTTLRYKYKEGEKLEYVVDQDQKMTMNILGNDVDMKTTMVMEMTWDTIKVDADGNATAKVTMTRVKLTMEGGPLGKVEVDSTDKNEPDDPLGLMFSQIAKSMGSMEMTFTADPSGDIRDVKVSEGTIKKLKKLPGVGNLGGDMFTPDSFKSIVHGSIIVPVPKEAVSKGKSWTQKLDTKTGLGKMTGETKYTYEGEVEKGGAKLEKLAIKPDLKIEADPNAPVQMKMKGGSGKGFALFDNKIGRIAESSSEGTMQMEIEAGGMTIDMKSTQTTTLRLKGAAKSKEKSKESSPPR
jgi:Family of unknown function (DUF6263)